MSSRHQWMRFPRTVAARVTVCCAAMLMLVGCGAGQVTQTDTQAASIDGANANIGGTIALRDVLMHYPVDLDGMYPVGSDVPLSLTIVNDGAGEDTLLSVTTPASPQVLVEGATTIPAQSSVVSVVNDEAVSPAPAQTAVLPSPLDFGEVRIVLTDLNRAVRAGQNLEITFVFENAGATTLSVPMALPPESVEREPLEGVDTSGGH